MKKPIPFLKAGFILLIFLFSWSIYGQSLLKGPYVLYDNSNTQMEVLWQCNATSTDQIRWGTDQNYTLGTGNSPEYGPDHQHKYIISGLTSGTKYYYQVTIGTNSYNGSFMTAPGAGQTSLKFYAYGDTRTGVSTHNQVAGMVNAAYASDPASQTFILSVGDLVNDGNMETYWTSEFFPLTQPNIREMLANLPMLSARGNHEGTGILFSKYFPYPYTANYYWSFDYGPAHFTVIDQYISYAPGSTQYNWIVNDLSNSSKPWKFVYLHEPGWSAGGGHANNTSVQNYLEPLFEQYNVAIVFGGHNHYYARAIVNGSNGNTVQHVTCGGGGAPLHTPNPAQPNIVVTSKNYHYCKINIVSNDFLEFQAVSTTGSTIDQFSIQRATLAISDVTASNITTGSALITWTTNLPSSSSVQYGTSTAYGNTATGSGGVTNHSVSLSGLAPNTLYHYRVISNNISSPDHIFQTGNLVNSTPTATTVLQGTAGTFSQSMLANDDGVYYVVNSTKTGNLRKCEWLGTAGTSISSSSAVKMTVTYNGKYSKSKQQSLYLFNYSTSLWDLIDSRNIGTGDVTVTYVTTSPASFISSSGEMKLKVYSDGGNKNYTCSGDLMRFTVETAGFIPTGTYAKNMPVVHEQEFISFSIYPNPFGSRAIADYTLNTSSYVQLSVFDLNGRQVMQIIPGENQEAGKYTYEINGSDLQAGLYLCKLVIKSENGEISSHSRKIVLIK